HDRPGVLEPLGGGESESRGAARDDGRCSLDVHGAAGYGAVDREGQVGGGDNGFEAIAAIVPTTVGILVVAGMPTTQAASHVEREMRAAVRGGMLGGSDLAVELALTALERAPQPSVSAAGAV